MKTNLDALKNLAGLIDKTGAVCLLWKPDRSYRASIEIDGRHIGAVGSVSVIFSFFNSYLIGWEAGKKREGRD